VLLVFTHSCGANIGIFLAYIGLQVLVLRFSGRARFHFKFQTHFHFLNSSLYHIKMATSSSSRGSNGVRNGTIMIADSLTLDGVTKLRARIALTIHEDRKGITISDLSTNNKDQVFWCHKMKLTRGVGNVTLMSDGLKLVASNADVFDELEDAIDSAHGRKRKAADSQPVAHATPKKAQIISAFDSKSFGQKVMISHDYLILCTAVNAPILQGSGLKTYTDNNKGHKSANYPPLTTVPVRGMNKSSGIVSRGALSAMPSGGTQILTSSTGFVDNNALRSSPVRSPRPDDLSHELPGIAELTQESAIQYERPANLPTTSPSRLPGSNSKLPTSLLKPVNMSLSKEPWDDDKANILGRKSLDLRQKLSAGIDKASGNGKLSATAGTGPLTKIVTTGPHRLFNTMTSWVTSESSRGNSTWKVQERVSNMIRLDGMKNIGNSCYMNAALQVRSVSGMLTYALSNGCCRLCYRKINFAVTSCRRFGLN
jgi:hypothetical protein